MCEKIEELGFAELDRLDDWFWRDEVRKLVKDYRNKEISEEEFRLQCMNWASFDNGLWLTIWSRVFDNGPELLKR